MQNALTDLFDLLLSAPEILIYLLLGVMSALENIIPPVPADIVVLFGGMLAGRGQVNPWTVFLVVWAFNVAGALLIYAVGRRYGPGLFSGRWGRIILRPGQLATLGAFYHRYGFAVIFLSRFLPMFRAVVPPFAGLAGIGFWKTAIPLAAASGLWYGLIVYVGVVFGSNWSRLLASFESTGRWLLVVAVLVMVLVARWWWRSRATPPSWDEDE